MLKGVFHLPDQGEISLQSAVFVVFSLYQKAFVFLEGVIWVQSQQSSCHQQI